MAAARQGLCLGPIRTIASLLASALDVCSIPAPALAGGQLNQRSCELCIDSRTDAYKPVNEGSG